MKIVIRKDKVYGKVVFYPVCEKAKIFAYIANTKTLSQSTLADIAELGYEITLQQETL